MMNFLPVLLFLTAVLVGGENQLPLSKSTNELSPRWKRNAVGALHIVTNHAQPIHADVKQDGDGPDKPCPEGIRPSPIESGVGFKVIPPEQTVYTEKSLRKSLPLGAQNTKRSSPARQYSVFDLIRSITRVVTFIVVFVSAVCEFYTSFLNMLRIFSDYMYK